MPHITCATLISSRRNSSTVPTLCTFLRDASADSTHAQRATLSLFVRHTLCHLSSVTSRYSSPESCSSRSSARWSGVALRQVRQRWKAGEAESLGNRGQVVDGRQNGGYRRNWRCANLPDSTKRDPKGHPHDRGSLRVTY